MKDHVFNAFPLDLAHPAVRDLAALLAQSFNRRDELRLLAADAGVNLERVNLERGVAFVWPDVLVAARQQGRHRALLAAAARAIPELAARIDEIMNRPDPTPAATPDARPERTSPAARPETRTALLLPVKWIYELQAAAVSAQLDRSALLEGIAPDFVAWLPVPPNQGAQILGDLHRMNGVGTLLDRTTPLRVWLENAAQLAGSLAERQTFVAALSLLAPHRDQELMAGSY